MAQPQPVIAGQRYIKSYKLSSDCTEWKVLAVRAEGDSPPHAQLVNCKDPFDMRTVCCAEIVEGGSFDLADENSDVHGRRAQNIANRARAAVGNRSRLRRMLTEINQAVRNYKMLRRRSHAS